MGKIYLGNSLIAGEGGGTQPTGQVITTFTLPQDVQDMLTVPHGIVIFSKNSGVDTLANSHPNIVFGVGYLTMSSSPYIITASTSTLNSYLGEFNYLQFPFSTSYKYFGSYTINNIKYYGCNRCKYSLLTLTYYNSNTANNIPALTITGKIIKIVNGTLITETFNGTTTARTVTSSSSSVCATIDLTIAKGNDDLICLIEVDSITVN